jgi:UDP-N-acetylglucosamine 2-epimerase
MFVGLSINRTMQALKSLEDQPRGQERSLKLVYDYATDNVSDKVLRIIMSYTDFVRRKVWALI